MDLYHTTDFDGVSLLNPDADAMRSLLASLDEPAAREADHPDVALIHDPSGWLIAAFPNGTVTLENLEAEDGDPLYLNAVSRKEALQLWQELSQGKIERVRNRPWICDRE
jgi:hypothetical protein